MHRAAATFTKMKFCPLIDGGASKFSALRCHQMKISQPGGSRSIRNYVMLFLWAHYIWVLFILAEVSASPRLPLAKVKKTKSELEVCMFCHDWWRLGSEVAAESCLFSRAEGRGLISLLHRLSFSKLRLNALNICK